jgi:phosphate uptake regulator
MAELTVLDEKLAEVLGLAQAAQQAAKKVGTLAKKEHETDLAKLMTRMGDEAKAVAERCQTVAGTRIGMKSEITKKAKETKADIVDFMTSYLEDAEALDCLEFLSMSEAGELAHWQILDTLNKRANDSAIRKLTSFALPLQEKHVREVASHALRLAGDEDPAEPA